jgi:hypothetical protein
MQSSKPPDRIIEGLEADVYHLLWAKDHEFEAQTIGTMNKNRPFMKPTAVYNKRKWTNDTGLGKGLLDLQSHARALRVKWALRYLDPSEGQWRIILDTWLGRYKPGRACIILNTPLERLFRHQDKENHGDSYLLEFWKESIIDLRELELKRRKTSPLGAESQPLWNNSINDVNPNTKFRKVWRALNTETVGHLTIDNHERYTREENEAALEKYKCDTIEGTIIFKGPRYVTTDVLDSFDEICDSLPKEWLLPPLTQKHLDRPCEGEWWGQRDALALLQKKPEPI